MLTSKTDGTNNKVVKKKKTDLTAINTGVLDTSNAVEDLIENQQKRIQCENCDKTFSNQYIAKYHNEKVHLKMKSKIFCLVLRVKRSLLDLQADWQGSYNYGVFE